jgi:apolipoprotein N-acyltransferase
MALTGWRRAVLAMVVGALSTLALPPVHAIPILWICFPILIWLIDGAPRHRGAFAAGWWWGFGHFSAGVYWIACALLIDPLKFGWMIPFAVFGLGGVLAIFPGLAAYVARRAVPSGPARVLVFAMGWTFLEWVRSWLLTGFTWNLIGSVWMPVLPVVQSVAVVGTYGLGLLTVIVAAMPATLVSRRRCDAVATGVALAVLLGTGLWGMWRLPAEPTPTVPGIHLRLVQGNVAQTAKWQPELRIQHLREYLRLTGAPGIEGMSAAIWPETAVTFLLEQDPVARRMVASAAPAGGLLITGVPRATPPSVRPFQIWNSIQAISADGVVAATYDKVHLVPFGEYVPLRGVLPLAKITAGGTDFTSGDGLKTLDLPGLPPVGPTICYEDIFPGKVVAPAGPRPSWLLNVTNDGWFGLSAGPYQHFAAARLRAVEEGLPLVRVANTGITGVVDPYGRVTASLPLGVQGVLDVALPQPLGGISFFARMGNAVLWYVLLLTGVIVVVWRRLCDG